MGKRIAVLVSGGGTNLQALIDAQARGELSGGTIAAVISSKPGAYALERADKAGIPHVSIEELKEKAYSLVGHPDDLQWEDKVVAVLEARDGTILDVVRKIKPYDPDQD